MDYKRYSLYEKKEIMYNILLKYPKGLTLKQIKAKMHMPGSSAKRIANSLIDDNKIRMIDFGNAKLYKVNK